MRRRCSRRAPAVALALTLLAGCATVQPVPVPCVAEVPSEPKWLSDTLPPDASAAEIVRALGADLLVAVQHGATLRAILGACANADTPPL